MAKNILGIGTLNGIDIKHNNPILTVRGTNVRIRLMGDPTAFCEGDLSSFFDSEDNRFTSVADLITYFNLNFSNIDNNQFTLRVFSDETYTYIGEALPGTATSESLWRIRRLTISDNTILFADGNALFDNVWDDHLTKTYI